MKAKSLLLPNKGCLLSEFFYFDQLSDEISETDLAICRSAFYDPQAYVRFVEYKNKNGIDAARPLLREVKFRWGEGGVNPIGDIMRSFIFSAKAADLIKTLRGDFKLFEPIDIDGTSAYIIFPNKIPELDEALDIFISEKYRKSPVVSLAFKDVWCSAGLLGAKFECIKEL